MSSIENTVLTVCDAFDLAEARLYVECAITEFLSALPTVSGLTYNDRRGIIARYTAVLEGNFIYWMTGAYLSAKTNEARAIIQENLHEEIRDCHPGMMRRFALAAQAVPTNADAAAVYQDLNNLRLFVGRLSGVPIVLMMGSEEMEYTDVHGVCDVAHTEGLFRALEAEAAATGELDADPFEGVRLLRALLDAIVYGNGQAV